MEFKPKITPEQVNEGIKKDAKKQKNKAKGKSQKKKTPAKENAEKKAREVKPTTFPVKARINDYGFLNFRKPLLEALGWTKGIDLTIEKNPDGSITIRKA